MLNAPSLVSSNNIGIVLFDGEKRNSNNLFIKINLNGHLVQIPVFAIEINDASIMFDIINANEIINQQQMIYGFTNIKKMLQHLFRGFNAISTEHELLFFMHINRQFKYAPVFPITDTAIIITGLIEYDDDMTLKTAIMYRKWYPNIPIIVSTWKDQPTKEFKKILSQHNIKVLGNNYPKVHESINFQLEVTRRAIELVKKNKNINYVIRTRTDWSINKPDFLIYLKNLCKQFPAGTPNMKERIISLGGECGHKFVPFHASDFLVFGNISDMYNMYSIPQQSERNPYGYRHLSRMYPLKEKLGYYELLNPFKLKNDPKFREKFSKYKRLIDKSTSGGGETYLHRIFYETYIAKIDHEHFFEAYEDYLKRCAIIIDPTQLLTCFPKYEQSYRYELYQCYQYPTSGGLDFATWLELYLEWKNS